MTFAEKLQKLREAKGLSREELAMKISVSMPTYIKYETGTMPRRKAIYEKLSRILDCDVIFLKDDTRDLSDLKKADGLSDLIRMMQP